MRRSGAPSQHGLTKRPKFISPLQHNVMSISSLNSNQPEGPTETKQNETNLQEQTAKYAVENHQALAQYMPGLTNLSEGDMRKKEDMLALVSKASLKKLSQAKPVTPLELEPKPRMLLSPHKVGNNSNVCNPGSTSSVPVPNSVVKTSYFSAMWCKASKKKHKKWEGDAVLSTSGRSATLYDTEGKIIARGTGYKVMELQTLAEDETLFVGGKEIQVMSVLTENEFQSGKCFSSSPSKTPTVVSQVSGNFKPFVNPFHHGLPGSNQPPPVQEKIVCVPKYDCTAENALVMPRPTPEQQWQNTKVVGQPLVDVVVDPHLSNCLRQHQREGVVFLYMCILGLREHGGCGAVLADDMGLGKTLQCITLIWTLLKQGPYGGKPVVKKVLIITPGSLVKNWYLEFKKWLGIERLNVYAVSAEKRAEDFVKSNKLHPVLILSYEMFVRSYESINQIPFDLIICDEGHRLKNATIKTTSLIMTLPCRRRVVLTGTPVQNDLQEFFSIVEFCNPGILGSSSSFRRVFEEPIVASRQPHASTEEKELGKQRARELTRLTQMFVLRRTQEVNNDFLPPKASEIQKVLYQQLLHSKAVRNCLQSGGLQHQSSGSAHLTIINALKQLCNHPALLYTKAAQVGDKSLAEDSIYGCLLGVYPESYNTSSPHVDHCGKLQVLSAILSSVWKHSTTDKVVLVSNHTKTLDMLEGFCGTRGYTFLRLDGQTPTGQRQDLVKKFNQLNTHRIFLLSSKAGGVGLNLIGASKLILYDIDWNPANDLQAMARVWRDGQRKRVCIYRLLTTGSIEEKVYQRQVSKQGLSGTVMDQRSRSASAVNFSVEDLKDLFSFNLETDCETHAMLSCPCEGHPGYVSPATPVNTVDRSCQLGAAQINGVASTTSLSNLTMAQLLSWRHAKGNFAVEQEAWHLEEAGDSLSYVFWNETNTQGRSAIIKRKKSQ